jgi:transcriptional antiterminator NusG
MPDPLEEKRRREAAAPFRAGDVVLIISRQVTASVLKVDLEREMLKVAGAREPIEIPFTDAQVISRAPAPRGPRRRSPRFDPGEEVRVIDGAFANFTAVVEEVFADKERLRVTVRIFGRPTPTELAFSEVERA